MGVDIPPAISDKSRNQEQQSGLRLMKIRYHTANNTVFISRSYYNACMRHKGIAARIK